MVEIVVGVELDRAVAEAIGWQNATSAGVSCICCTAQFLF
jgi:hypothetical protein